MSPVVPNWDLITSSEEEYGGESKQPAPVDFAVTPEIHFPGADDYCLNIFDALSDVELNLNLPTEQNRHTFAVTPESSRLALDRGNSSSGSKGKSILSEDCVPKIHGEEFERILDVLKRKQASSCKRNRTNKVHNLSERKRRDRINEKIRTLQELIPNCNKSDRASVLDGAIQYLKALKLQVEMMSMCGGSLLKAPYVSPAGVQSVHPPQFSPFMPMSLSIGMGSGIQMGFGMGMMCYQPMDTPFIAVPAQSPCSPAATAASLSQMPRSVVAPIAPLVPMKYMPFTALTSTPAIVTPSISPESPALKRLFQDGNPSNWCSSRRMQISVNDVQQVPVIDEAERADLHEEGCLLDSNK